MKNRLRSTFFLLTIAVTALIGISAKTDTKMILKTESDPELEIESWMVQDDYWTSNTFQIIIENEEALDIEPWMEKDCYWK